MEQIAIDYKYLKTINSRDPNLIFGDWINNIEYWSEKFKKNKSRAAFASHPPFFRHVFVWKSSYV